MSVPIADHGTSRPSEPRLSPSWASGWRLAVLVTAGVTVAIGVVFAWDWLTAGGVFVVFVIVVPCIVVCVFVLSLSGTGRGQDANGNDRK